MRRFGPKTATVTFLLLLSGCHRNAPVAALPPPLPPVMVSVPPPEHPLPPELEIALEKSEDLTILLPRHTMSRFRPSPVAQVTLAPLPPPPIELGQLTTGDTASLRQETEDLMRAQERRLIVIPAAVAALHSQQVEQARLFLLQAEEAWQKLDMDGAHTLAIKAKVLLDEVLT